MEYLNTGIHYQNGRYLLAENTDDDSRNQSLKNVMAGESSTSFPFLRYLSFKNCSLIVFNCLKYNYTIQRVGTILDVILHNIL